MRESDDIVGRACQRRDVLRGMARRRDQLDRWREMIALGWLVNPGVAVIDRLKIMDARRGEKADEDGMVGVMMGNHDIRDRAL